MRPTFLEAVKTISLYSEKLSSNEKSTSSHLESSSTREVDSSIVKRHNNSVVTISTSVVVVVGPSGSVLIELSLRNRLNLVYNNPLNTLSARRSGEGTVVGIVSLANVEAAQEISNLNIGDIVSLSVDATGAGSKASNERVVLITTGLSIEEDTNDSEISDTSIISGFALVDQMDKMHLKIVVLVVNGMLRRSVHMELSKVEGEGLVIAISIEVVTKISGNLEGVAVVKNLL